MKKILMVISVMMFSLTSFAQAGSSQFSVHANYLLDSPNNFGIGANVGYEFVQNVRGVGQFDYYFKTDGASGWNANVNVEYLFRIPNSTVTLYPLAGLNVFGWSVAGANDSKLGLNLGAGVEVPISSAVKFKAEYNYKTQYDGISALSVGLAFPM